MIKTLMTLLLALCAGAAAASPVAPPDWLHVYFDEEGTYSSIVLDDGVQVVTAYLILKDPTTTLPYVLGWEARLTLDVEPTVIAPPRWTLAQDTDLNVGSGDDHVVGCGDRPLPFVDDMAVLASITLLYTGEESGWTDDIYIGRVTDSQTFADGPGYASEVGVPIPAQPLSDWSDPAAVIILEPCANDDLSWGEVKSLY